MKILLFITIAISSLFANCADSGLEQTYEKSIETHYMSQDTQVSNSVAQLKAKIDNNQELEVENIQKFGKVFNVGMDKNSDFRRAIIETKQILDSSLLVEDR